MHRLSRCLLALLPLLSGAVATAAAPTRGELLYTTHCIACHSAQVHWRDKRLVTDWASLQGQVFRWQSNAGLGWTVADVNDVARYLNARYYRLPEPGAVSGVRRAPAAG